MKNLSNSVLAILSMFIFIGYWFCFTLTIEGGEQHWYTMFNVRLFMMILCTTIGGISVGALIYRFRFDNKIKQTPNSKDENDFNVKCLLKDYFDKKQEENEHKE